MVLCTIFGSVFFTLCLFVCIEHTFFQSFEVEVSSIEMWFSSLLTSESSIQMLFFSTLLLSFSNGSCVYITNYVTRNENAILTTIHLYPDILGLHFFTICSYHQQCEYLLFSSCSRYYITRRDFLPKLISASYKVERTFLHDFSLVMHAGFMYELISCAFHIILPIRKRYMHGNVTHHIYHCRFRGEIDAVDPNLIWNLLYVCTRRSSTAV